MEDIYKEVYFNKYCGKCKYEKLAENESPCDECMDEPVNLYSRKPVKFEENKMPWLYKEKLKRYGIDVAELNKRKGY